MSARSEPPRDEGPVKPRRGVHREAPLPRAPPPQRALAHPGLPRGVRVSPAPRDGRPVAPHQGLPRRRRARRVTLGRGGPWRGSSAILRGSRGRAYQRARRVMLQHVETELQGHHRESMRGERRDAGGQGSQPFVHRARGSQVQRAGCSSGRSRGGGGLHGAGVVHREPSRGGGPRGERRWGPGGGVRATSTVQVKVACSCGVTTQSWGSATTGRERREPPRVRALYRSPANPNFHT